MSPNDADGIANSVDPDQTAPLGAVWSGSALFAQTYLSENLGSLRYCLKDAKWSDNSPIISCCFQTLWPKKDEMRESMSRKGINQ